MIGPGVFPRFHGSSIPDERIRWPDLSGLGRIRQKHVKTGSWKRLPHFSIAFLAFSAQKWRVSSGISSEIHGILLQEPSFWVLLEEYYRQQRLYR
ncbi:unnamed protein product [Adineta ricciae]|uniref:Uncharacterized protein n=1 Tax=Adineta ricciae TaxID=249248 RepID=A0A816EBQ1_ADIRI|nr:unnamed protein product [Adineta ricciae]